jgi:hypothetical protein
MPVTLTQHNRARRRIAPWLWVMGILVLIITGSVGVFYWWLSSERDLDTVRSVAQQQGVSVTWEAFNQRPDAERLKQWKRSAKLMKRLEPFQSSRHNRPTLKSLQAIPDEMRTYHAAIDEEALTELLQCLDNFGDQPFVLHQAINVHTLLPDIGIMRDIVRLLQERLLLCEAVDVPVQARRLLAFCRTVSPQNVLYHLVHFSLIEVACSAIAARIPDIKRVDPSLAADLLLTTQGLIGEAHQALTGEFLILLQTVKNREMKNDYTTVTDWFTPLVVRHGRQEMLLNHLAAMQVLKQRNLIEALEWSREFFVELDTRKAQKMTPGLIVTGFYAPPYEVLFAMEHYAALRGQLLAAEIREQPWPVDSFDPTGAQLRALIEDGRLSTST